MSGPDTATSSSQIHQLGILVHYPFPSPPGELGKERLEEGQIWQKSLEFSCKHIGLELSKMNERGCDTGNQVVTLGLTEKKVGMDV